MHSTEWTYVPRWRLFLLVLLVICAGGILIAKLWQIQIADGETYVARLHDQTTVATRLSPARGAIVDRNGIPLAENKASFDVDFYLDEMVRSYKQTHRNKMPKVKVIRRQGGKLVERQEPHIYEIVKDGMEQITGVLGIKMDLDDKELQEYYYQTPTIPYQYRSNVDFETMARFSEHSLGVPGIEVTARPVRFYTFGALAPHLLGYVGRPTDNERVAPDGHVYESVGHAGVEDFYDGRLQGLPGGRVSKVNNHGYVVGVQSYEPPTVGNSIYVTLDARIQFITEQVMRNVGRGAAVIMDPNNGDILALVSVPSFDPNGFIPKIAPELWKSWNNDPTSPLLNRAVSNYAPGSTFKIVTALAALKAHVITPTEILSCPPFIDYGGIIFKDHSGLQPNGLGSGNLFDALRVSCNVYFYQVGNRVGINGIESMARSLGLGEETGVPLTGEAGGMIPGMEWFRKGHPHEKWTSAKTASISIGQGEVLVTPLQMAAMISAVANGGTVYVPRLTVGVADLTGQAVQSMPTQIRGQLDVRSEDLAALRQALLGVVEGGTGKSAALPDVKIAGKTGSAQFKTRINGATVKDTRAWFVGFAPFEKPRYAFAIMVEGGASGGHTAAPLAHEILKQIFEMEKTGVSPAMTYLTPAIGNFSGVSEYVASADPTATTGAVTGTTLPGTVDANGAPIMVPETDGSLVPTSGNNKPRNRAYSR